MDVDIKLDDLNTEWARLCDYIHQYPHLPSDHPLVEGALEGCNEARAELEKTILVKGWWEEFLKEKDAPPEDDCVKLAIEWLGVDQLEFLVEQSENFPQIDNDTEFLPLTSHETDLSDEGLPLFVKFLNQIRPQMVLLCFESDDDEESVFYTILIEDDIKLETVPDIAPFQKLAIFGSTEYPNLARLLMAPSCTVTGLFCSPRERFLVNETRLLSRCLLQFKKLKKMTISPNSSSFALDSESFQEIVDALRPCHALEIFEMKDVVFDGEHPPDHIQTLIKTHDSLRVLLIEEHELDAARELRPPTHTIIHDILSHVKLNEVSLPMGEEDSAAVVPLIKGAAESGTIASLKLGPFVFLTNKNKNNLELRLRNYENEHHQDAVLAVVPQVPNWAKLELDRATQSTMNMFLDSSTCNVSSLDLSIDDDHFGTCFQSYPHLVELSLTFKNAVSTNITRLCPKSTLKELKLVFGHGSQPIAVFPIVALALNEQQQLEQFIAQADSQFGRQPFLGRCPIADAVQHHPSLIKFVVGSGMAHPTLVEALFDASEHNKVLRTLEFCLGRSVEGDGLINGIPKAKHLRTLHVSTDCFVAQVAILYALKENMSICNFVLSQHQQHNNLAEGSQFLARNRLLRHVSDFGEGQERMPLCLWPHLLAKLGSNHGEATPLHALLVKRGASELARMVVARKRKLVGD